MDCQTCKNREICKWVDDMQRLQEIVLDAPKQSESPVLIEVKCTKYHNEIQELIRRDPAQIINK